MAAITCRKCGLTVKADDPPPSACPGCGAIYARVEAAARDSGWTTPSSASRSTSAGPFITELRAGTHYPAFRSVTRIGALLFYLVVLIAAGSAIVVGFRRGDFVTAALGVLLGVFLYVLGRASMEASTMLADLSDAAVYTAERHRE